MLVGDWLQKAEQELVQAEIISARLDSLILLEDLLDKDRSWILAHAEQELSSEQMEQLTKLLTRRKAHEPIAYIRGKSEFYGRTFVVSKDVLVPRPESESFMDLLLKIYSDLVQQKANLGDVDQTIRIADIGTGSGALGISAKLVLPNTPKVEVELIDIDENALKVAKTNVDLLTSGINTLKSDLLDQTTSSYDVLMCNLPYVPEEYCLNADAKHEPKIALFSGKDGLDHYRKLFIQIQEHANKPLYLLFESLEHQHTLLSEIAAKNGYKLLDNDVLVQVFKRA